MTLQPFTSESVTEGHPDKVADRISDSILDAMLEQDPKARVAIESLVTTGLVFVTGEVTTSAYVEIPEVIREAVKDIGYTSSQIGFDADSCGIMVAIDQQSPDIAGGVNESYEARTASEVDAYDLQGAGDQGIMFGYATNETTDLMPLPIHLSHRLAERLTHVRKSGIVPGLRPDGKTQVTIDYGESGPVGVNTVIVSTQHDDDVSAAWLERAIREHVIDPVLAKETDLNCADLSVLVNPSGRFILGGPRADAGLTGRKIIVDTYGGMARHGGGAFSGKDPSKVDRSAAYAARWVAKNVVAAGLADRCEVQLAYAIGKAQPVSIRLDTFGTEKHELAALESAVDKVFDLRPAAIISELDLLRPIYSATSAYGHFGRTDEDFTWERTNKVEDLRAMV
ncbi:S-adenosylmethionine synthetase [Trueperella bonasi]|uniref:S-adenosylmethionine synthase n=1 Tax=Trueperella bonasi TaxID=312286 RepID=A0ABT9NDI9_9ACTO|nr:methionine adenosyltransferase [Trueperella bonasi]MDP9805449.1 S-adenosylmethionine synthetase [Trueperella bonasi]